MDLALVEGASVSARAPVPGAMAADARTERDAPRRKNGHLPCLCTRPRAILVTGTAVLHVYAPLGCCRWLIATLMGAGWNPQGTTLYVRYGTAPSTEC